MLRLPGYAVLGIAAAITIALSACGGGGGGGTMNQPTPMPSPSVCPSPNNAYPPNDCTTYTLGGSSTQTITRALPTPTPPASVANDVISETSVVHTNQIFHGITATDFKTTETDAGPNQTITTKADIYFTFPTTAGNVVNIGFHSTDSNGVILDEHNLAGNGIVGQIPLGPSGWANNAAQNIIENDPDGTTTTTTVNGDGSYNLTRNEVAGTTTITLNSDGTANEIVPADPLTMGFANTEFSVGAISGGTIPFTGCMPTGTTATPCTTPAPYATTVPAWYPPSPTLASDATTVAGSTAIPPGCTSPTYAGNAEQLHEVKSRLDTMLGYTDNETIDTWVSASAGPVCEQINDTIALYYDFTGQTGIALPFALSGTPVQTTTLLETIGLQTVALDSARHPLGAGERTRSLARQVSIANVRLERFRQAFRAKQLRSLREFLKRGHIQ